MHRRAGDFNDWLPGRSAAHVLDHRLGASPRPATFPVHWPLALDRIWVQSRRALRRVSVHATPTSRVASDHFPLVAELDRSELAAEVAGLPHGSPALGITEEAVRSYCSRP